MPRPQPGHRMMIRKDGDDHLRLRRLVSKVFTPRAISQWQARAESIVERLLAAADERTEVDVIADYALPLPVQVISEMLGMPPDDTPTLRAWSRTLAKGLDPSVTPEEEDASAQAGRAMYDYVEQVVADKRASPGDDILTALIQAEEAGDRLDDRRDPGPGAAALHRRARDDAQPDRQRPDPPVPLPRPARPPAGRSRPRRQRRRRDAALRQPGAVHPAGQPGAGGGRRRHASRPAACITLALGSANRDPRKWGPTADIIDVARPGANEHVSFGGGSHFCLGESLARLEGKIALPRLVRRFPKMSPAYDEPRWARTCHAAWGRVASCDSALARSAAC